MGKMGKKGIPDMVSGNENWDGSMSSGVPEAIKNESYGFPRSGPSPPEFGILS
jgi:hypothetical protein